MPPAVRSWLWLLVIVADLGAATFAGQGKTWDLTPGHVAERHGLFVIIALGESLIVAGTAVAGEQRTTSLVVAGLAAVTVVALQWWSYFDWFKESLEEGLAAAPAEQIGSTTRDAYSLTHFPLVCGIVGVAVAVEEIMVHPDAPAPLAVRLALAGGVLLFLGATVLAHLRLHGELLVGRAVAAVVLAVAVASFPDTDPWWPLLAVAAGLLVLVVAERGRTAPRGAEAAFDLLP